MAKIQLSDFTFSEASSIVAGGHITGDLLLPILAELDEIGLSAVEVMSPLSFAHTVTVTYEDPWQKLRRMKATLKNTKLQLGFAGQNLCGRSNFPDDAVEYFVQKAIENGVDIFRVWDPLNDTRNMETVLRAATLSGTKVIAGVIYTGSEMLKSNVFTMYAKQLEEMGASAISILDPAGILRPYDAYQLVKSLRAALEPATAIHLHSFCRTGMAQMAAMKAAEAGVDVIDAALSPLAMGNSLPSLETLISTFEGTPYATELPTEHLGRASNLSRRLYNNLKNSGYILPEAVEIYPENIRPMIPADLAPTLFDMMRDAKITNKLPELADEIAEIRAECGHIPLSSPVAEIVLSQAVFNLLSPERYDTLTKEFKSLTLGEYGRSPSDIQPGFRNRIAGTPNGIDYRPADRMEPVIDRLREEIAAYMEEEEDVLTYAMLGAKAREFFETRRIQKYNLDAAADFKNKVHSV